MRTAAGRLTDDGGAFLILQVKCERLGARERVVRREHENSLLRQPRSWQVRQWPVLLRQVLLAVIYVDQVRRSIEQVARNQRNHRRLTAAVLPQIENDRVGMRYKGHRRNDRGPAEGGIHEFIELNVAYVIRQDLNFFRTRSFHSPSVGETAPGLPGWARCDAAS